MVDHGHRVSRLDGTLVGKLRRGERVQDDSFLLLFNASDDDLQFVIPPRRYGPRWSKVLDTACATTEFADESPVKPGDAMTVINHSLQLLRRG